MATQREIRTVYAAGVAQGIVPVTFPAASTIFTDPDQYDQLGYGIAAFGIGPLLDAGVGLPAVYAAAAGIAAGMGLLSFAVARRGVGTEPDVQRPRAGLAS